ncbi:hypothetical protein ES703_49832 [subsurface metagenome]
MMYSDPYPVKQMRATLRSDPLRDNRMRLRRISVRGNLWVSPPSIRYKGYPELPLMPQKPRGFGGRAPKYYCLSENLEITFHAEPRCV